MSKSVDNENNNVIEMRNYICGDFGAEYVYDILIFPSAWTKGKNVFDMQVVSVISGPLSQVIPPYFADNDLINLV